MNEILIGIFLIATILINFLILRHKKTWSGLTRIMFDLSLCLLITIILTFKNNDFSIGLMRGGEFLSDEIAGLYGSVIGLFFTIFFWSWHQEQVQQRVVRRIIQFLYFNVLILMLPFCIIFGILGIYNKQPIGFSILLLGILWLIPIIYKYKKLMGYEHPKYFMADIFKNNALSAYQFTKNLTTMAFQKLQTLPRIMKYFIIILMLYLIFYQSINSYLGLQASITTIPLLILMALLNKTTLFYIFLIWFSWNLFSILRALNNTWTKSLEKNK